MNAGKTPATSPPPRLSLVKQTATAQEILSKNGIHKNVHVVVKNTPFELEVALLQPIFLNNQVLDLRHLSLDVSLLYDYPVLKPVSFVRAKPCEYKLSVNDNGDKLSLNTRIKVLTSQHEDMLFRVKLKFLERNSKMEFNPQLEILSEPIKVISKQPPSRKRKRVSHPKKKRRTLNDLLVETVQRIEATQKNQQAILKQLDEQACLPRAFPPPIPTEPLQPLNCTTTMSMWDVQSTSMSNVPQGMDHGESDRSEEEIEFTQAILNLMYAYKHINVEDKPSRIRKVMRKSSTKEGEQLSELFSVMMQTSAIRNDIMDPSKLPLGLGSEGDCNCEHCPHRRELCNINQFYTEFLTTDNAGVALTGINSLLS